MFVLQVNRKEVAYCVWTGVFHSAVLVMVLGPDLRTMGECCMRYIDRVASYRKQNNNGPLTPRQKRRVWKKSQKLQRYTAKYSAVATGTEEAVDVERWLEAKLS